MGTGQAQAMKSPQQWLNRLDNAHCGHTACCSCERCKHGQETFLLESDIAQIQADALGGRELLERHLDYMHDLRGEWTWKANEPRCGYQEAYEKLTEDIKMLVNLLNPKK